MYLDEYGNWRMEGLRLGDPMTLRDADACEAFIQRVGFLPLMRDSAFPVSLEQRTTAADWWSDDPARDPWEWRGALAGRDGLVYGKFIGGKATFVSRDWFTRLARVRRQGRTIEEWFEDGLLARKALRLMETARDGGVLPSLELKRRAGFGRGGERGFEGAVSMLEKRTFLCVRGFARKRAAAGHEYGWPASQYLDADALFTPDEAEDMSGANAREREAALAEMTAHVLAIFPRADEAAVRAALKGEG